jgi:phosphoribosylglycinamide formyltransferase 1
MTAKRIVILISGRGSNMEALLDARLPATIAAVISNRPDAAGLDIARRHGVPSSVVDHRQFAGRPEFDSALAAAVDRHAPHLVLLAGFMRVLTQAFVERYSRRMLNIHPSLLPAFPGLHTHARAVAAGVRIHGCTVHFVTPTVDHGPIVAQAAVAVQPTDTEEALAERVLALEHRIYPEAARWFCEDRMTFASEGPVLIDGVSSSLAPLVSPALDR